MRNLLGASFVLTGLLLALPARAGEKADPKAVIDKAIQAHGGAEALAKFKARTIKTAGKFHQGENAIDYTAEFYIQAPDGLRTEISGGDGAFKMTQVYNGKSGWIDFNGNVQEMNEEMLEEAGHQNYVFHVVQLAPLTDKKFKLSPLGPTKVNDTPAVGVKVESAGHRDVSLFFDAKTGLLIKTETVGKDAMNGFKEYKGETFYGNYKKVDGVMVPFKVVAKRDGVVVTEGEHSEVKVSEKLDAKHFAKP